MPPMSADETEHEGRAPHREGATPSIPDGVGVAVYIDRHFNTQYPSRGVLNKYRSQMLQRYMTAPIFEYVKERLGVGYGAGGGSGFSFVMPTSPVFDLMKLKTRLAEAIHNQAQAEGCIVQPNILLHSTNPTLDPGVLQRTDPDALGGMQNATDVMMQVETVLSNAYL